MSDDTAHSQLTAYLLSILVHHDRGIRAAGPPRNRQEWGIGRIGDYLRAIGRETIVEGGEAELSYDEVGGPDRPDWIDSFLTANRDALARLAIATSVRVKEGRALVVLTSSDRLGAIPIRSPITRKITGGLLVEPRFGWSSIV